MLHLLWHFRNYYFVNFHYSRILCCFGCKIFNGFKPRVKFDCCPSFLKINLPSFSFWKNWGFPLSVFKFGNIYFLCCWNGIPSWWIRFKRFRRRLLEICPYVPFDHLFNKTYCLVSCIQRRHPLIFDFLKELCKSQRNHCKNIQTWICWIII